MHTVADLSNVGTPNKIFAGVPVWLSKKKFSERENLKWKVYVLMLPAICLAFFCLLFCGEKAYHEFTLDVVFTWLGLTFFAWFINKSNW